ncbi:MAG: ABC transporter permease [Myxococcales bacterium]|nr:MAG: ABC transporter permease [Myxococcales bacterium]
MIDSQARKRRVTMTSNWFREFWVFRELFYFLVWRDVKVRYKQTLLGVAWAVIQPFFSMIIFTLFFGRLAGMPSDGIPYPIFTYAALVPWTYFSTSLSFSGNSLVSNSNLVKKVYFPRAALPAAAALAGLIDFAIASGVLVILMIYYKIGLSWELLMWPVLVLPLAVLVLGVGMILSALNVKYRDVKYAIPFGIQIWMFLTPIIYPTSIVPERYRFLAHLNPLTGMIEAFRAALLPDRTIHWLPVGTSCLSVLVILFVGAVYFQRSEREFSDVI